MKDSAKDVSLGFFHIINQLHFELFLKTISRLLAFSISLLEVPCMVAETNLKYAKSDRTLHVCMHFLIYYLCYKPSIVKKTLQC